MLGAGSNAVSINQSQRNDMPHTSNGRQCRDPPVTSDYGEQ